MAVTSVWSSFFFNDTATTEIYTLSLHDALPICPHRQGGSPCRQRRAKGPEQAGGHCRLRFDQPVQLRGGQDRKRTSLNSSHANISYAGFCLKKKNNSNSISSALLSSELIIFIAA